MSANISMIVRAEDEAHLVQLFQRLKLEENTSRVAAANSRTSELENAYRTIAVNLMEDAEAVHRVLHAHADQKELAQQRAFRIAYLIGVMEDVIDGSKSGDFDADDAMAAMRKAIDNPAY